MASNFAVRQAYYADRDSSGNAARFYLQLNGPQAWLAPGGSNAATVGNDFGDVRLVSAGGAAGVVVKAGGYVGINTADPQASLDVSGDLRASGVVRGDGSGMTNLNAAALSASTVAMLGPKLTHLNASYMTSGYVALSRLPPSIVAAVNAMTGDGSTLTNLNASELRFGTIDNARLTPDLVVASVTADGAGLRNLNATHMTTGTLDNARLPAMLTADGSLLTNLNAASLLSGTVSNERLPSNLVVQKITSDDGSALANLNASMVTAGTLNNAHLPPRVQVFELAGNGADITSLNASAITSGFIGIEFLPPAIAAALEGAMGGDGSRLTNLNASAVASGTLADARLPPALQALSVAANGGALTNLNASAVASGTLNNARLPPALQALSVAADGAALGNLNASAVATGTLADARLPPALQALSVAADGAALGNLNASAVATGTLANQRLPSHITVLGITSDSLDGACITSSLVSGSATVAASAGALSVVNATASAALPRSGGTVSGDLTVVGQFNASNVTVLGSVETVNAYETHSSNVVITNLGTGPALIVTQTEDGPLGAQDVARFCAGSNVVLSVTKSGGVGVGKGDASCALDVSGGLSVSGQTFYASNVGIGKGPTTGAALDVSGDARVSGTLTSSNISFTGALIQNGAPYIGSQWTNLNGGVTFASNVAVGKSSFLGGLTALDVSGDARVSGTLTSSNISFTGALIQNGAPYIGSQWTNLNGGVTFSSNVAVGKGTFLGGGNYYALDVSGALSVAGLTYCTSNVGIGKPPSYGLDVSGTVNLNRGLTVLANGMVAIGKATVAASNCALDVSGLAIFSCNVGIGLTNPSYALEVKGDVGITGDISALYSDDRLKTRLAPLANALEKVSRLSTFTYRNNVTAQSFGFADDRVRVGLSAQEVASVLPEAVTIAPFDRVLVDGREASRSGLSYTTVQYDKLVPLLVAAIQELDQKLSRYIGGSSSSNAYLNAP